MPKIICIRHGAFLPSTGELTPDGIRNLDFLRQKLDRLGFAPAEAYISTELRSQQTALLLAPRTNLRTTVSFKYDKLNAMGELVGWQMDIAEQVEKSGHDVLVVMHSYIPAFFAFGILKIRKSGFEVSSLPRSETFDLGYACGWLVDGTTAKYLHF